MQHLVCLWLLFFPLAATGPQVHGPRTSSAVMIDGILSNREWDKATRVEVPGVASLYFQRSTEFVYIAIKYTHSPSGIVDLYLSPAEGEIFDLHASAKLGEREMHDGKFPDWLWWNNRDWIANVSRVDSFDKRTFLPAPVREYQIRRSRFPSTKWRLRFELTATGNNNETQPVTVFPSGTLENSTVGWLVLNLE